MKNILVVEDEEHLRKLYSSALSSRGYSVSTAENGQKGIEFLNESMPDLILLDLIMPVMNGCQFLSELKKDQVFHRIPVIIITNSGEIREIGECLSMGAIGYIDKNGTPSDIVNKVETIINTYISVSGNYKAGSQLQI